MYTGMLHTHKSVVILFLLLYVVKTVLLFANKDALAKMTKITKVPEMILSVLFLATGGYMLSQTPNASMFLWIKIGAVFASIPLAVIGFKKENKALAALSLIFLFAAYGLAEVHKKRGANIVKTEGADAKTLFEANCASCHGTDGAAGIAGAKNLQTSTLSDEEAEHIIRKGKNGMSAYEKHFTDAEIKGLVEYVKTLRK